MSARADLFFIDGGTLPPDARCYVPRAADETLFQALLTGELSYVLTPRQMGKSSLMVRTSARLRQAGVSVVILDLTRLGSELTIAQWYDVLCRRTADQLGLNDAYRQFRAAAADLSPLARWTDFLSEVVIPGTVQPVVLFVDEIDVVRRLPFDTDEFFAALRSLALHRAEDPEFNRLTFCLLGVAAPADLISDPQITPFNIGRRIVLSDFTQEEAAPLTEGFGNAAEVSRLLGRILFWTGGHPYLTQKLCRAMLEAKPVASAVTPAKVDEVCSSLFLTRTARDEESNLASVSKTLFGSGQDTASLMALYARIYRGERVPDDETSRIVQALKVSGLVRGDKGV